MSWVPVVVWLVALVLAFLVLGYLGWEVAGKARRLRADIDRLNDLTGELAALQREALSARVRIAQAQQPGGG